MGRRRSGPPLIPGFWIIVAAVVLISSVGGFYFILARETVFERQKAVEADGKPE
jgi:hypothetical protein